MFDRGQEFILKVGAQELFFNGHDSLPVERVFLYLSDRRKVPVESFNPQVFPWIKVWVDRFSDGVLDCDVTEFDPARAGFENQQVDLSNVRKMLLLDDSNKVSVLAKTTAVKPLPKPKPVARRIPPTRAQPLFQPQPPPAPKEFSENIHFRVPLDNIQFAEGCAAICRKVYLPQAGMHAHLEFSIENAFLSDKLNCIKPYLGKCLGGEKVEVRASVRSRDGVIEVVKAESPTVDAISPKLIGEVRYRYVESELSKRSGRKGEIITADRFFKKVKGAGFGDSDEDFIADILRAKQPRHSAHIEYLAERHRSDHIKLRIVNHPFAFLCFLTGKSGGYFIWETLDGTDATYIWKLGKPLDYLSAHRREFKQRLGWIEKQISVIHAAGRNEYLKEAPPGFRRIIHDYRTEGGFEKWETQMDQLLDSGFE